MILMTFAPIRADSSFARFVMREDCTIVMKESWLKTSAVNFATRILLVGEQTILYVLYAHATL
jgi:hypothetical protein